MGCRQAGRAIEAEPAPSRLQMPSQGDLAAIHLQRRWRQELPLRDGERLETLWQQQGRLYALTSENRLYSLDSGSGIIQWFFDIDAPYGDVYRPVGYLGTHLTPEPSSMAEILSPRGSDPGEQVDLLAFNTRQKIYVLDREDGTPLREIRLDSPANTAGTTDGRRYYIGTIDGKYHAIDLQDALKLWTLWGGDLLSAPLEVLRDRLFIASEGGRVQLSRASGIPIKVTHVDLLGAVTAPMAIDERACFAATETGRLYALSSFDLGALWPSPFISDGSMVDAPQATERTVLQRCLGEGLYAIDRDSGEVRWSMENGREAIALTAAGLYLRDDSGGLMRVDEDSGEIRERIELGPLEVFARQVGEPRIWAGTPSGELLCCQGR
jgi:outer membrane protein assembly factor BamB